MLRPRTSLQEIGLVLSAMLLTAATSAAQSVDLPQRAPRPEVHAAPAGNVPVRIGDTPVPEPRPLESGQVDADAPSVPVPTESPGADDIASPDRTEEPVTPSSAPLPAPSPETDPKTTEVEVEADPRSAVEPAIMLPSGEIACRQRLEGAGVAFEAAPPQSRDGGCSLPYPLSVSSLGGSVVVSPPAVMNCAMAEALADFTRREMQPAAQAGYGQPVTGIEQASAFVCRPRHGTAKLSEHAFGNALDIARIALRDGTAIEVGPDPDEKAARFLAAVRKAACGPFKTVLGPGSDADHANHLHFDLQPRRNGGTFC
jgi:hypothetical protein